MISIPDNAKLNIALKTEFSFRKCFLHIKDIHKYAQYNVVGVADYDNTFAHIPLWQESSKYGFHPIFGVRLRVSAPENERLQTGQIYTTFIAIDDDGLEALYKLVQKSYDRFYYFPRLHQEDIEDLHPGIANLGEGVHENYYPDYNGRRIYQLLAGSRKHGNGYRHQFEDRAGAMGIIPLPGYVDLARRCTAKPRKANMVKWGKPFDLKQLCMEGATKRALWMTSEYMERLDYELNLIKEKDYEDYFMIVADLVQYAKKHMLVGPSRGSSAGSLVCYLLEITEIDPIKHNLIFERFIDVNRFDLPDIDIDFPDKYRGIAIDYLVDRYGRNNVRCLANVNRLQPKSAIGEFAQSLGIPKYETAPVKDAIIERSSGDARAAMCISDTFSTTEPGKALVDQYPAIHLVEHIEGHAAHAGKHAAGIIVSTLPLTKYAGIDTKNDILMMDKRNAEAIDLLKIDALGLRTLSILQDTTDQIPGMSYSDIYNLPLDDEATFEIFNSMRLSGVFQFEGYALQSLTRQMGISKFGDIVAITALARPGALNSGGASRFVRYRTGAETPRYISDTHQKITRDTYGITVYQEQMMEIAREIGGFSWADVSTLRKAASKSMGDEFFGKYKDRFVEGAMERGLSAEDAEDLWNDISHSGSWSFNKSHAVSYGLISYWTAYFKANYPLEFAVASLNNARDDEHAIKLLRDITVNDKLDYVGFDPDKSQIHWSVQDGMLVGGFTNIHGVGEKKAALYMKMRTGKKTPTATFWRIVEEGTTVFDILFPTDHYFGRFYKDPVSCGLNNAPQKIKEIQDEGQYLLIGVLRDRNLRDLNEYVFLKKRDGKIIEDQNLYLNLTIEDDTDSIICTIDRWRFDELGGKEIAEKGKVGESWYLIKGRIKGEWRKIQVDHIHQLTPGEMYHV